MVDVMNVDVIERHIGVSALKTVDQAPSGIMHRGIVDGDIAAAHVNAVYLGLIYDTIRNRSVDIEVLNEQIFNNDIAATFAVDCLAGGLVSSSSTVGCIRNAASPAER